MNNREVLIAEGVYSKLTITLNDGIINKLALIEKDNNPLAKVEKKLNKALAEFEKSYYQAVSKSELEKL